jgi:large subunit ribosomal protein L35
VRQTTPLNASRHRFLSSSVAAREEVQTTQQTTPPSPPPPATEPVAAAQNGAEAKEVPEYMQKWGELDPNQVEWKRDERRLVRREGTQPVGSRRRRAAIHRSSMNNAVEVPFEQMPYQCFQEARKFLLEDRQEKLKDIATQNLRINNLIAQDPAVSGGPANKEHRLRSMRTHLQELIILADINDPMVKKKFEDGQSMLEKRAENGWY